MTHTDIQTEDSPVIEGIEETAIAAYFTAINREDFTATAALFAEDGAMLAPFEKPIVGREKITAYLTKEATGMKLLPKIGVWETEEDTERYKKVKKVLGKVRTSLFSVNVAWYFTLNSEAQITSAKIKLLASPQELLNLQGKRDRSESYTSLKKQCDTYSRTKLG